MSLVVRVQTRQVSRANSKSGRRSSGTRGKGRSTPASTVNATQSASSTHASNAKKHRVENHSDADIDTPLQEKIFRQLLKL